MVGFPILALPAISGESAAMGDGFQEEVLSVRKE